MATKLLFQEEELTPERTEQFLQEIKSARNEWILAEQQLNYSIDPDLIDHAIYLLDAAEKKFGYLLREARRLGITCKPY